MAENEMGKDVLGPGSGTNEGYTQSKGGKTMPLKHTKQRNTPAA